MCSCCHSPAYSPCLLKDSDHHSIACLTTHDRRPNRKTRFFFPFLFAHIDLPAVQLLCRRTVPWRTTQGIFSIWRASHTTQSKTRLPWMVPKVKIWLPMWSGCRQIVDHPLTSAQWKVSKSVYLFIF